MATTMELYHRLGEQAKRERGHPQVWHEADIDGHHLYMADTSFGDGPVFRFDDHAWQIQYGDAPITKDTAPEDLAEAIEYGMRATWVSRFDRLKQDTPVTNRDACWELIGDLNEAFPHQGFAHIEVYANGVGRPRWIVSDLALHQGDLYRLLDIAKKRAWYVSLQAENNNLVVHFDGPQGEQ